jgi:hypothetical protein
MVATIVDNPTEAVPIVANALASMLCQGTVAPEELLALIWVMPVSIVVGTFFWAVAGLDTYDNVMTPFQIWIFEITYVSRVIGCAIDNDFLCTASEERSAASSSLPFLPDENQEDGPSL